MFKFVRRIKLKKRLKFLKARKEVLEIAINEDMTSLSELNGSGVIFTSYFYRNLEEQERELADVKEEMNYIQDELRKGAKNNGRH